MRMRGAQPILLGQTLDPDRSAAHLNHIGEGTLHPPKKHHSSDQ